MALAVNVMNGGHMPSAMAQAVNGNNINSAVTATGTAIGTAADLVADVNVITAGGDGTGVQLYAGMPGDEQVVYNATSTTKKVYPPSASIGFNQLAVGSAFILQPYTAVFCKAITSTLWVGFLSA